MKKETEMREHDIEDLFAEARSQGSLACAPLMAKVFADALAHQPALLPASTLRQSRLGFWAFVVDALGGKGGLAGIGTAAAVGIMLGFVQPTSVMTLTDQVFVQSPIEELDLIPGVDAILTEG